MNTNPIYIVDDDNDEEQMIRESFEELGFKNELRFFNSAEGLLSELRNKPVIPFLIISDVNLPKMDGFELRERILREKAVSHKSVPFIFWSTKVSEAQIKRAYDLSVHGFFLKGTSYKDLKDKLQEIVKYWDDSLAPSS